MIKNLFAYCRIFSVRGFSSKSRLTWLDIDINKDNNKDINKEGTFTFVATGADVDGKLMTSRVILRTQTISGRQPVPTNPLKAPTPVQMPSTHTVSMPIVDRL